MKNSWLNIVLRLTNRIYSRKQLVIGQTGMRAVANIFGLIVMEMALSLISLPLYLALSPEKVMAYFAEKGSYAKVNFDYSLRRILTVTGVGVVAFIWAFKLVLILAFPLVHGPLQLYSVSDLQPVDALSESLITAETGIQTARIVNSMPKPQLAEVRKAKGGNYSFVGQGQPHSTVVLLLTDISTAVYTAVVDKNGVWQIDHSQNNFKLNEGNHSVVIFSYDPKLGTRSEMAPEQFFKATSSWLDRLTKNIDSLANWLVIIIITVGAFLIFLTI
ncbi:MAG: hypothetical protein WC719_04700 [Patescibacteria group bacterium]|jgi:hypothetical protein